MQLVCEGHPQIERVSPGLRVVLQRPTVLDDPVLVGQSDADVCGASIYGSVIREQGIFRMWYQAWPKGWDGKDVAHVACVESDNGLDWRRPTYGLVEVCGSKNNHLTDLPFHCPSVFQDPTAEPMERYRAFGYADPSNTIGPHCIPVERKGYFSAHSADGLHWELDSFQPIWPWGDVIISTWDSYRQCARVAMKRDHWTGGMYRRTFRTTQWSGGPATPTSDALIPDEYDDIQARIRGFNSADYYGMGWMPTAGATFGFLWNFRHQLPFDISGNLGRIDLSLVYQLEADGRWRHVTGRPDWLSAEDAPTWARGALVTASSSLDVGDESWLYFTGVLDRHGWCGNGVDYGQWIKTLDDQQGFAKIGLLKWPRDRLIG